MSASSSSSMSAHDDPRPGSPSQPSAQTASVLLRLGISGAQRPVDELLARLDMRDGCKWLESALTDAARAVDIPVPPGSSIENLLCAKAATPKQLEAMKDHGKRQLKNALTSNDRCAGLAAYFFSIASALKHHGTLIGAKRADGKHGPREELHQALLDLASATDRPWTSMLGEAALAARRV